MKPRHAAVLALVGWYLMMPPIKGNLPDLKTDTDAPLSRWQQRGAYDTAKACEEKLEVLQGADGLTEAESKLSAGKNVTAKELQILSAPINYARCVATDDPRLKEK